MLSVVVIEDDAVLRRALARLLGLAGYRVGLFASPEAFIEAAPVIDARCLLVDIHLGKMSGLELARGLTAAGSGFRILFMTTSEDDAVLMQVRQLGYPVLRKTSLADRLLQVLAQVCGSPNSA
jgi:FixJ family two-component response regulator